MTPLETSWSLEPVPSPGPAAQAPTVSAPPNTTATPKVDLRIQVVQGSSRTSTRNPTLKRRVNQELRRREDRREVLAEAERLVSLREDLDARPRDEARVFELSRK